MEYPETLQAIHRTAQSGGRSNHAIARGVVDGSSLDPALLKKLGPAIDAFRVNAAVTSDPPGESRDA